MERDPLWHAEVRGFTPVERIFLAAGRWAIAVVYACAYLFLARGGLTYPEFAAMTVLAIPALTTIILLGWLFGGTWRD